MIEDVKRTAALPQLRHRLLNRSRPGRIDGEAPARLSPQGLAMVGLLRRRLSIDAAGTSARTLSSSRKAKTRAAGAGGRNTSYRISPSIGFSDSCQVGL
jgi:hypothetical protein